MRRINLLPPEERGRPADRLRRGVVGILLIVGAFVLILMVGVYLVLLLRLNDLEDQVAQLDDEIARQNAHLAELSPYRDLRARLEAKKPIADGIFRSQSSSPWNHQALLRLRASRYLATKMWQTSSCA
jgi:type IV pilus assembly protein PilN